MNQTVKTYIYPTGQKLLIVNGDLTSEKVDAIVNAANERLLHGGGIAALIARRGGAKVIQESANWIANHGLISHSLPAYTTGGNLPCRFIIHAVGPIWGSGNEDAKLAAAITGSINLAKQLKLSTIAFPAISTGIFGFPKRRAARVFLKTIEDYFLLNNETAVRQVRIVLFGDEDTKIFVDAFENKYHT